MAAQTGPYARGAQIYRDAGWAGVLPIGEGRRNSPPAGVTGRLGRDVTDQDVVQWVESRGRDNLGLRMPPGVIGLDVDCHDGKPGAESLEGLERQFGPLPRTWSSTSREDGSAIYFFGCPSAVALALPDPAPGIELIKAVYRYAAVWPSVNEKTGRVYRWYGADGLMVGEGRVPRIDELAALPQGWHRLGMQGGRRGARGSGSSGGLGVGGGPGWSAPDVAAWTASGIPAGTTQDSALRDLVWQLAAQGEGDAGIEAAWWQVVSRTVATRAGDPWTARDFQRHLRGAREKLGFPEPMDPQLLAWARNPGGSGSGGAGQAGGGSGGSGVDEADEDVEDAGEGSGVGGRAPSGGAGGAQGGGEEGGLPSGVERPEIDVTGDVWFMAEVMRLLVRRCNEPPTLFRTAAGLGRLGRTLTGEAVIRQHTAPSFTEWLSERARWTRTTMKGVTSAVPPPEGAVKAVMDHADLLTSAPGLERLVRVPFYTADGQLVRAPGYVPLARAWYQETPGLEIPPVSPAPRDDEIAAAVKLLTVELLGDFPFAAPGDLAAAVGLIVQPFVRELIAGATPLFVVDAPVPGTGKSLMAELCLGIFQGAVAASRLNAKDDQETRKQITALLLEGRSAIMFDNVSHRVESDALAQALTQPVWSDRMLGKNINIDAPVRCTWVLTSNNAQFSQDIMRRAAGWCRLDLAATTESNEVVAHPERRSGFRHPDLREWAAAQRGDLIWAALTLCQAWIARGRPDWSGTPIGSFEGWSRVIGGILESAGIAGFTSGLKERAEHGDVERDEQVEFVQAWWGAHGEAWVRPLDLVQTATLCGAFHLEEARDPASRLGYQLRKMHGRVIEGFIVQRNTRVWRLQVREDTPFAE